MHFTERHGVGFVIWCLWLQRRNAGQYLEFTIPSQDYLVDAREVV